MTKALDLKGKKFGRWKVIERSLNTDNGHSTWVCKCDCGTVKTVRCSDLTSGKNISCGCYNTEICTTHNMTHTRIYQTWSNMKERCRNPRIPNYKNYGGRGIKVCDKWHDFSNFYQDMIKGYAENLEIERINVNGNYEPSNCKWVTEKEQCNNKRTTHYYTLNGITDTLKNICDKYKMNFECVRGRIRKGKPIEEAIKIPSRLDIDKSYIIEIHKTSKSIRETSRKTGHSREFIKKVINE